jgi:hypothetical protein
MAALARHRIASFRNVEVETSTFEEWDNRGRRFDVLVYAETADLHERFCPGNPDWGHPPLEEDVRGTDEGWGLVDDPGELFGPTIVAQRS